MTNEDLLNIAQAFAYLEMKIEKVLPESPDRAAAISHMEDAAGLITKSARREQEKVDTALGKHLRLCT